MVWALGLLEWVALFSFLQADKLARIINTATKKKENGVFILRLLGVIIGFCSNFKLKWFSVEPFRVNAHSLRGDFPCVVRHLGWRRSARRNSPKLCFHSRVY